MKKTFTIALTALLIQATFLQVVSAASKAEKQAERIEKVKAGILKLGVGNDARVTVKLRDNAKLVGYISEANGDSFTLTDSKTSAATTVVYGDVAQVKGNNLGTGAKIAIGIGIGVGATILFLWLYVISHED